MITALLLVVAGAEEGCRLSDTVHLCGISMYVGGRTGLGGGDG